MFVFHTCDLVEKDACDLVEKDACDLGLTKIKHQANCYLGNEKWNLLFF